MTRIEDIRALLEKVPNIECTRAKFADPDDVDADDGEVIDFVWYGVRSGEIAIDFKVADFITNAKPAVTYLLSEIERIRGVLEFYARAEIYDGRDGEYSPDPEIEDDRGEKARQALNERKEA